MPNKKKYITIKYKIKNWKIMSGYDIDLIDLKGAYDNVRISKLEQSFVRKSEIFNIPLKAMEIKCALRERHQSRRRKFLYYMRVV